MIVANWTPDPINWMHMGITGAIPGYKEGSHDHIVEMDDARAKHILNEFAKIGLVQMRFGDDPKIKRAESIALYNRFWEHQITTFNQGNEQQKEQGNRYNRPTDLLSAKAEEFDLELRQPWKVPKKADADIQALRDENAALRVANKEQGKQIAQILEMLKAGNVPGQPEPEGVLETPELEGVVAANRKKYASLAEKTMKGWLKNNWDEVQAMPEENQFEIKTKYQELYETPFPAEKPS